MNKNLNTAKSISSILPKILKPITKKYSSKLLEIKAYWRDIVGEEIACKCIPTRFYNFNNKNYLEISVINNNALEISYFSCKIKNKINNFFENEYINVLKIRNTEKSGKINEI